MIIEQIRELPVGCQIALDAPLNIPPERRKGTVIPETDTIIEAEIRPPEAIELTAFTIPLCATPSLTQS
jgi:hypothetical protein